jgi:hypothetical protein
MARVRNRFSTATYAMLNAIRLSVSLVGSTTASNVASASMMLWARVNDVTTFTRERKVAVAISRPTRRARDRTR